MTPLHMASANSDDPAVIELLILNGSAVQARDKFGWTPLHWAAAYNTSAVVDVLLSEGADLTSRGEGGLTPLHLAASNNESASVAEVLIAAGSDVLARDDDGLTPLHMAAADNSSAITLSLLAAKSEIEARDNNGRTPLHWSALQEENLATKFLRDTDRETSKASELKSFIRWSGSSKSSVIASLIGSGAIASVQDDDGKSPFDYVEDNERLEGQPGYWLLNEARFGPIKNSMMVGSCPSPIKLGLRGVWNGALKNDKSVETLRANPARKAIIAAIYDAKGSERLSATILSLGSIDKFQGNISSATFETLVSTMASQIGTPSVMFIDQLELAVSELAKDYSSDVTFSFSNNIESSDNFAIIYGQSEAGHSVAFDVAVVFRHIAGCIISINFSILSGEKSLKHLHAAVHDFKVE